MSTTYTAGKFVMDVSLVFGSMLKLLNVEIVELQH